MRNPGSPDAGPASSAGFVVSGWRIAPEVDDSGEHAHRRGHVKFWCWTEGNSPNNWTRDPHSPRALGESIFSSGVVAQIGGAVEG
jgi:hypothetical protein